jgi:NAD(P)-dependent dehydrogenase (short-subunit alcohol dehydrogenase family)
MSQLKGKIALVTGGTTGIGLAAAQQLHAEGAKVIVTGQNPATLEAARQALPDDVLVLRSDARSLADNEQLAAEIERRFGGLDIAFLNAGIARFAPLDAVDEAFYDDILDINVKGVFFAVQKLSRLLRPGASVLVTTSVVSGRGNAGGAVYAASKGALVSMVKALAVELAPRGIRVNSISPGPIDTPIFGKLGIPKEALGEFAAGLEKKVPLGRFGKAEEVARVALFVASSGASFVTGADIPVDGGVGINL